MLPLKCCTTLPHRSAAAAAERARGAGERGGDLPPPRRASAARRGSFGARQQGGQRTAETRNVLQAQMDVVRTRAERAAEDVARASLTRRRCARTSTRYRRNFPWKLKNGSRVAAADVLTKAAEADVATNLKEIAAIQTELKAWPRRGPVSDGRAPRAPRAGGDQRTQRPRESKQHLGISINSVEESVNLVAARTRALRPRLAASPPPSPSPPLPHHHDKQPPSSSPPHPTPLTTHLVTHPHPPFHAVAGALDDEDERGGPGPDRAALKGELQAHIKALNVPSSRTSPSRETPSGGSRSRGASRRHRRVRAGARGSRALQALPTRSSKRVPQVWSGHMELSRREPLADLATRLAGAGRGGTSSTALRHRSSECPPPRMPSRRSATLRMRTRLHALISSHQYTPPRAGPTGCTPSHPPMPSDGRRQPSPPLHPHALSRRDLGPVERVAAAGSDVEHLGRQRTRIDVGAEGRREGAALPLAVQPPAVGAFHQRRGLGSFASIPGGTRAAHRPLPRDGALEAAADLGHAQLGHRHKLYATPR